MLSQAYSIPVGLYIEIITSASVITHNKSKPKEIAIKIRQVFMYYLSK